MAELTEEEKQRRLIEQYQQAVGAAKEAIPQPAYQEYNVPQPKESDYVKNEAWFNQYFPTVSKEDEAKRERKAWQAYRWGAFGNALGAIASAIGGAAPSANTVQYKAPDVNTWRQQLNTDRKARAAAEMQQKQNYITARNTWLTGKNAVDNANIRSLNDWQKAYTTDARTIFNAGLKNAQNEANIKSREKIADNRNATTITAKAMGKGSSGGSGGGEQTSGDRARAANDQVIANWAALPDDAKSYDARGNITGMKRDLAEYNAKRNKSKVAKNLNGKKSIKKSTYATQ